MTYLLRLSDLSWPCSRADLMRDSPATWFPPELHDAQPLSDFGYALPVPSEPPEHDPTLFQPREVMPVQGADGQWRQAWVLDPIGPPPPAPDWGTFKAQALSHPALNQAIAAAIPSAPAAALALPAALLRAEQGDPADFRGCWRAVVAAAPVAPETVAELATLAQNCKLPKDFVDALRISGQAE